MYFSSKIASITEELTRAEHPHYLHSSAYAELFELDTSTEHHYQIGRFVIDIVNKFATTKTLIDSTSQELVLLLIVKQAPNFLKTLPKVNFYPYNFLNNVIFLN